MAMNGYMHKRSNVARLYLPRREGGRALIGIEEYAVREKKVLYTYIQESNKWILKNTSNERVLQEEENLEYYKKITYQEKKNNCKRKISLESSTDQHKK